jgi:uncharacterized membrane protein YoaK (UPF0700 family)
MSDVQLVKAIAVPRPIPVMLSFVAGYVDSCTYLALFGVFVAQLTGSFALAATQFVRSEPGAFVKLLAIPSFFLAGMAVTVLVHSMRERPPRVGLACSLGVECLLLIGFLTACMAGTPFHGPDAPGAVVALLLGMAAMGAQSALVRLLMRGVTSTNVMTMNTTLLAINTAEVLLGWMAHRKSNPSGITNAGYQQQARREIAALLPLELGFLAGTALGVAGYVTAGLPCIFLAIVPVGGLALWFMRRA